MKRIALVLVAALGLATANAEEIWQAGAGRVNITPDKFMWMAGYGGRDTPADGKTTDLWAKALLLDDGDGNQGVVISLDLVGIDRETTAKVCERLKDKFGFERRQIAICTSHTHSGPVVGKNLGPLHYLVVDAEQQKLIDDYARKLIDYIETAVGEAIEKLEPARIEWGNGLATFAVNRRENPSASVPDLRAKGELKGPVDHDVPVLSVRTEAGELRAVLFGYACHATTVGFNQWNGDYPGYAQIELEKAHPDCVALFWAGCGADQNPLPRRTVNYAEKYGAELAQAVEDVLAAPMHPLKPELSPQYREIDVKLQQLPDAAALAEKAKSTNRFEVARAKLLQRQMEERGAIDGVYPYPIGVWKIGGEIDFIHLGGEVVVDYAVRLKRELRGEQTWVAGYANDVMAYIPSLRVLKEGGYEGGGSNMYYGLPGLWDESSEEAIIEATHELAK
ncbi:MAG: neutral ceramidase [Verrucomicrobiales bacterium]|jgi:neutral ceramidase